MKSASLAIEPLMLAERDREYLKQLRRNRWVVKCEKGSRDISDAIVCPDVNLHHVYFTGMLRRSLWPMWRDGKWAPSMVTRSTR